MKNQNLFGICDSHCWSLYEALRTHKKKKKPHPQPSGHILKEERDAKWNADWKEEKINQARLSDWQLAKVFSVEVSRTVQLLSPVLRLSFCFSLSPGLIHHLPLHPSSHCCLLVNVSPNSPSISLTFHSIVPPLPLSLAHTLSFSFLVAPSFS